MDPGAFYSSVAQVGSSFVAFLGGFFIIRLQNYAEEWRHLRLEINRLNVVHNTTRDAYLRLAASSPDADGREALRDLARRNDEALRALAPLLYRRENSHFPVELIVQFVLLVALTFLGVWFPLILLSAPDHASKIAALVPLVSIVMLLWMAMLVISFGAWRRLRAAMESDGATA